MVWTENITQSQFTGFRWQSAPAYLVQQLHCVEEKDRDKRERLAGVSASQILFAAIATDEKAWRKLLRSENSDFPKLSSGSVKSKVGSKGLTLSPSVSLCCS